MATVDDITLAGIGVGGFERTTLETVEAFRRARVILHLTAFHEELRRCCRRVVNLGPEYWTGEADTAVYPRLTNRILEEAARGPRVVFVGDGHPMIYDDVLWDVYRRGRRRGLRVRILPAISSLDAMAASCELEIDSLQIVEAMALVAFGQPINPRFDLLVMQVGWFGTSVLQEIVHSRKGRFIPLVRYLRRYYPAAHPVRVLKAPGSKADQATVMRTRLSDLDRCHRRVPLESSLLVPALDDGRGERADEELLTAAESSAHLNEIAVIRPKGAAVTAEPRRVAARRSVRPRSRA